MYESNILKIEARVAPILFLRAPRSSWRTRRGRDDQDKASRQQEMVSIATTLFIKLQTGDLERHGATRQRAQERLSSRPKFGAQADKRVICRVPDREFCWLFDGVTTTSFMFRLAEAEKVDGSRFFCSKCCWILTGTQYVQQIGENHHYDSVWWGYLSENHRNSVAL